MITTVVRVLATVTAAWSLAGLIWPQHVVTNDQWLAGIVGGANCCNCKTYNETIVECDHLATDKDPIPCKDQACIVTTINTDACMQGGKNANCATNAAGPAQFYIQNAYTGLAKGACDFGTNTKWVTKWPLAYTKAKVNCTTDDGQVACQPKTLTVKQCQAGTLDPMYTNVPQGPTKQKCP